MVNYNAIINVIDQITKVKTAPCKKTLQKIVFLIQAKGEDLGCDYGIHFFGPYSYDLDFAIRELCDEGDVNIKYTSSEHKISIRKGVKIPDYRSETASTIIREFATKTPSELELLATALYVYLSDKDVSKVLPGVVKIKGSKYSESRISSAIETLKENGFIAA